MCQQLSSRAFIYFMIPRSSDLWCIIVYFQAHVFLKLLCQHITKSSKSTYLYAAHTYAITVWHFSECKVVDKTHTFFTVYI